MRASMAREILGREGSRVREVVVEAVFDHRTDGHLRFREELLDGLRQQVRGGMADDLQPLRVAFGDDRERRVARR